MFKNLSVSKIISNGIRTDRSEVFQNILETMLNIKTDNKQVPRCALQCKKLNSL